MLPEEEEGAPRPKAVTIIGRLWLVLAVYFLGKDLVNLAIWKVLQPDAPSIFGSFGIQEPRLRLLRPLFAHMTAFLTAQAVWWAVVGVAAFALLRLRPWARVAVQGVSWVLLAYGAALGLFWVLLPGRGVGVPALSHQALGLVSLVAVLAAAGLITMIVLLRAPRVREAFERGRQNSNRALEGRLS